MFPLGPIGLVTLLVAKSMGASQVLISGKVHVLITCVRLMKILHEDEFYSDLGSMQIFYDEMYLIR